MKKLILLSAIILSGLSLLAQKKPTYDLFNNNYYNFQRYDIFSTDEYGLRTKTGEIVNEFNDRVSIYEIDQNQVLQRTYFYQKNINSDLEIFKVNPYGIEIKVKEIVRDNNYRIATPTAIYNYLDYLK